MEKRTHSEELKTKLVREAVKGKRSIKEIAEEHDIHPNLLWQWVDDKKEAFDKEMLKQWESCCEIGYVATRFKQMMDRNGGYETAKRLINMKPTGAGDTTYGLGRLCKEKRLDLSVEALACKDEWAPLFTEAERNLCREKLLKYGYDPESQKGRTENNGGCASFCIMVVAVIVAIIICIR